MGGTAAAQETVKIGLILPMTGPFASTGRQIDGAVKLWMQQNGTTVAGKKIEVILKDDGGTADTTRRLAQELVVNDKVAILAGFGLTPLALATVPVATQAKVPMVVMAAATSMITEQSPFVVRGGFTLPQVTSPLANWAWQAGIKKVVTLVTDFGPGIDAETTFKTRFVALGGQVPQSCACRSRTGFRALPAAGARCQSRCRVRVRAVGVGAIFMKQFAERGLDKSGIRLIGTGDVTDDDILNDMGDVALGVITSFHYSAAHDSAANKAYVAAYRKLNGKRPNFMSVGGYDGMRLIYKALEATKAIPTAKRW